MPDSGTRFTTAEQRQRHLEAIARDEAGRGARIARARLIEQGREGATEYGRQMFAQFGEVVSLALEDAMGNALSRRVMAGPYYAGMLQLMGLATRGPRAIAAIALGVVVDRVTRTTSHRALAKAVGAAVEAESYALPIEARGQDLLRLGRRRHGKRLVTPARLTELRVVRQQWSSVDQFLAGAFLLQIVLDHTGLLEECPRQGRRGRQLRPTALAMGIAAAGPPTPLRARRLPMLVPPRPWKGLTGGGHLDSGEPLVRSRQGLPLDYLEGQMDGALRVVNTLQRQPLEIDRWMVAQQRMAWDSNLWGLFPLQRDPLPEPPRPQELIGGVAFARWRAEQQRAIRDRVNGRGARVAIERSLRRGEELAGQGIWLAWYLDFRGRCYTSNRVVTPQGPDHEKAVILSRRGQPCGQDGADWLLKAAAGHWGERSTWGERLAWGELNRERLRACAVDPLDRVELWRDAKDPWQFLACCRAWHQWSEDPTQPVRQLIRLDQTTSGPGIIAALLRDATLAASTNMTGSTRRDLYSDVALALAERLRSDLEAGTTREQRLAAFWLERGVTRALVKGPVMSTVYGALPMGVSEQLVLALDEAEGEVSLGDVERKRLVPCRYLARALGTVLRTRLASALALQQWLRRVSLTCLQRNQPISWTAPTGFPVVVGRPAPDGSSVPTLLHGKRRWQTLLDQPEPGELSARETGRSITANLVHSFDASLVWTVVCDGARHSIDVLPNHDCFAVPPCHATWLSQSLADNVARIYRADWLAQVAGEIAARAGGWELEAPPMVGDLAPGQIGTNPYLFS